MSKSNAIPSTNTKYSKDWYSVVYEGFVYASMIAFIIAFFTNGETSLGAYIAGYIVLSFGILMILLIIIKNILKTPSTNPSAVTTTGSIIVNTGPFLFILSIVSLLLYLLITYKNKIIEGNISPSYGNFTNLTSATLLLLLYIIYTNIRSDDFKNKGKFTIETTTLIYFFSIFLWIFVSIIYVVLCYYTTDGFTLQKFKDKLLRN